MCPSLDELETSRVLQFLQYVVARILSELFKSQDDHLSGNFERSPNKKWVERNWIQSGKSENVSEFKTKGTVSVSLPYFGPSHPIDNI